MTGRRQDGSRKRAILHDKTKEDAIAEGKRLT